MVEILIVLFLILINGFFAMSEIAVVSSRRSRLQQLAGQHKAARTALALVDAPTRFLSTVQVGITLVGVLAGAYSGATIAAALARWLAGFPLLAPYAEALGLILVVAAITFLSLIFGELVPKRLALSDPERIATRIAPAMRLLSLLVAPVAALLGWSSSLVLRLIGARDWTGSPVTEEEIRHMVDEGAQSGAIDSVERDMVSRVFRLGDKLVRDLMTPRTKLVWLDREAPLAENLERIRQAPHSRFPVTRGDRGEAIGIVQMKDIVTQIETGRPLDLFASMRQPLFVPETTEALRLLEIFADNDRHVGLVVDEYGDVQGIVTPNDLLQAVVGEVALSGGGAGEQRVTRREDGSYLIDGLVPADELKELLHVDRLPGEEEHDFSTIAGMMVAQFGRIPVAGDFFDWQGARFEVLDMDGPRIDKVLVVPRAEAEGG